MSDSWFGQSFFALLNSFWLALPDVIQSVLLFGFGSLILGLLLYQVRSH